MLSEAMKAEGADNVVRFAPKCRFCDERHQVWQLCGLLPQISAPPHRAYKPEATHGAHRRKQ